MGWLLVGLCLGLADVGFAQEAASTNSAKPRRERRKSLAEMFEEYDADKDGRVTAAELQNPGMMMLLDKDNNGYVTRREVSESVTSIGVERRWARPEKGAKDGQGTAAAEESLAESLRPVSPVSLGVGRKVPALRVKTVDGSEVDLGAKPKGLGRVIAVTSSSCPVTRKFAPGLGRLEAAWAAKGVEFVYVGALPVDSAADLKSMATEAGWKGAVVRDADERVGAALGLRTTAEVLVLDAAGTLVYRGAVNDQYGVGYARAEARQRPLEDALTALEQGLKPLLAATTAPGCVLERKEGTSVPMASGAGSKPTYHGRISRLMQTHCGECHFDGGVGPFSLESYADVVGHAGMIRKQVEKGQMPPWFSVPVAGEVHGKWANDRTMPEEDRKDLLAWLAGDRAEGDPAEAPLPVRRASEWAIGKPDAVYGLPKPVKIPAEGVMAYEYAFIDTDQTEDRWIQAMEIRPTDAAAVHHVLVWVEAPGGQKKRGQASEDEISGFFGAYVPGNASRVFPEGFGKALPAGATLKFQIHYTPYGKATNDQMRIAFRFAPEKPRHVVHVVGIANPGIRIPAGASNHEEWAALPVPREARILSFLPHMHVRGKAFRYEVMSPDGESRVVLDVPRYDFNWQLSYQLAEPLRLEKGSRLRATAWFDNSSGNPANPDPAKNVRWGNQTFEEMMIGYLEYYLPGGGS
jgi:mono/diheme cytochrome c family protein